jgi:hypothetical protein
MIQMITISSKGQRNALKTQNAWSHLSMLGSVAEGTKPFILARTVNTPHFFLHASESDDYH